MLHSHVDNLLSLPLPQKRQESTCYIVHTSDIDLEGLVEIRPSHQESAHNQIMFPAEPTNIASMPLRAAVMMPALLTSTSRPLPPKTLSTC